MRTETGLFSAIFSARFRSLQWSRPQLRTETCRPDSQMLIWHAASMEPSSVEDGNLFGRTQRSRQQPTLQWSRPQLRTETREDRIQRALQVLQLQWSRPQLRTETIPVAARSARNQFLLQWSRPQLRTETRSGGSRHWRTCGLQWSRPQLRTETRCRSEGDASDE